MEPDKGACERLNTLRNDNEPEMKVLYAEWLELLRLGAEPSDFYASSSGTVNVRGYMRSDGTYVHSYSRAAPGHGGGHRYQASG